MKIRIEIDEKLTEDEVVIRCGSLTGQTVAVERAIREAAGTAQKLPFYVGNTEYYLRPEEILFFETDEKGVGAHTREALFWTKYKLYELESLLPGSFMRVSKSAILNIDQIYSISRNLTASSVVAFEGTHKTVYVSRYYYKPLIGRLEERRLHHEK